MNLPNVKKSLDSLNDFSQAVSEHVDSFSEQSEKIYDLAERAGETLIALHKWLHKGGGRETHPTLEGYVGELAGAVGDFNGQNDALDNTITDMLDTSFRLKGIMTRLQRLQKRDFKKG